MTGKTEDNTKDKGAQRKAWSLLYKSSTWNAYDQGVSEWSAAQMAGCPFNRLVRPPRDIQPPVGDDWRQEVGFEAPKKKVLWLNHPMLGFPGHKAN